MRKSYGRVVVRISYLMHVATSLLCHVPDRSNLKEERFTLAPGFSEYSSYGRKAHWAVPSAADWEAAASTSWWIRKQRCRPEWLCLSTIGHVLKAGNNLLP